jgi:hypothetical protein
LRDNDIDITVLSETWLKNDDKDQLFINELQEGGYRLKHVPRISENRGGGVALLYKSTLDVCMVDTVPTINFEYMEATIRLKSKLLRLLIVYRPPPSAANGLSTSRFQAEFENFLEQYTIASGELLITGDFNLHVDVPTDTDANHFKEVLDSVNLKQHVNIPTHIKGHTLDLIITRDTTSCPSIDSILAHDFPNLDHYAVTFNISVEKPCVPIKTIQFRKYKTIDQDALKKDLQESELFSSPRDNLEELVCQYNAVLTDVLDRHAPVQEKKIALKPESPWYTEVLRSEKRKRRKLERKWRKTGSPADRKLYREQCSHTNKLMTDAKTQYYSEMVNNSSGQKELYKVINRIMHKNTDQPLPKHDSDMELADRFVDFFQDKIEKIRTALATANANEPVEKESINCDENLTKLTSFTPMTEEEVRKIIVKSANKSCALDPIPTWLVKDTLDILLPVITSIINKSLSTGEVPPSMKNALVIPILKKILLDCEILKNFRPVSNLSFLSKVTEKAVSIRTDEHTQNNNLDNKFQSAYKTKHSTETALLRVQNDILVAADDHKVGLLILLDLSAAFDTIDHDGMLTNLKCIHGIDGTALNWYKSYLSDRYQSVIINGAKSKPKKLACGVPQGSILGPEMYTKYTKPLTAIIEKYGVKYHIYADDTQLYIFFETDGSTAALKRMEECIAEIRTWLRQHMLKLNDEKTEVLLLGSKNMVSKFPELKIHIGKETLQPTNSARNIGVIFDKHLDMKAHIISTCKSANYHIYKIWKIRKFLTREACEQLVHAFISTKLDYGNSLLYGIPGCQIQMLQKVQNSAARVICKLPKFHHITQVLKDLHWLPVKQRITFKVLLMTYKALNGLAPPYISELLSLYEPSRMLRSSQKMMLVEPRTNLVKYGDRAFKNVAPKLWNKLPQNVKCTDTLDSFKLKIKSILFKEAFD